MAPRAPTGHKRPLAVLTSQIRLEERPILQELTRREVDFEQVDTRHLVLPLDGPLEVDGEEPFSFPSAGLCRSALESGLSRLVWSRATLGACSTGVLINLWSNGPGKFAGALWEPR